MRRIAFIFLPIVLLLTALGLWAFAYELFAVLSPVGIIGLILWYASWQLLCSAPASAIHTPAKAEPAADDPTLAVQKAQTEQALAEARATQERFDLISKATNDAIYDWKIDTDFVWFSDGMHTLFGYSQTDIKASFEWWMSKIHPDDAASVRQKLTALSELGSSLQLEYRLARADGSYAYVMDRAYVFRDAQMHATRVLGSIVDITTTVAAERHLQEEKAKDEAILQSIGDAVVVTDADGNVLYANLKAEQMFGIDLDEAIGKHYENTWWLEDKDGKRLIKDERPITSSLAQGKTISTSEYTFVTPKKRVPVDLTVSPVKLAGQTIGAVAVFRDITEDLRLDQLKDEFVSVASHELRTPMTAIRGFISMMLEGDYGEVPAGLKEPLADIQESTERLIRLVNDMLNVSRIEAGRLRYDMTKFAIGDLIASAVDSLKPIAMQKGISLTVTSRDNSFVFGDANKISQVLLNLIGNSLKFTDQGAIEVSTHIEGQLVEISVKDTGMGIAPQDQAKLFGKFSQILSQQEGKPAGSGLGLYVSRELIRTMGGELWIQESEVGKGSTFTFSVPLADSALAGRVAMKITSDAKAHPDQKSD